MILTTSQVQSVLSGKRHVHKYFGISPERTSDDDQYPPKAPQCPLNRCLAMQTAMQVNQEYLELTQSVTKSSSQSLANLAAQTTQTTSKPQIEMFGK